MKNSLELKSMGLAELTDDERLINGGNPLIGAYGLGLVISYYLGYAAHAAYDAYNKN